MGGDEQHWACAECSRKCFKEHGRRSPPNHFSFFKIMMGNYKKHLMIPPKFARLLRNLIGQKFYLENSNGHRCEVKLLKVDNCLAFQQGWTEFVSSHSVQVGEILVFKYISNSIFVIQIFGTSGCERSHFSCSIDGDMHKQCQTDCFHCHKDGRKNDTSRTGCCIGEQVPSKKRELTGTAPCETFASSHLHCKEGGDFHKKKRPATESLCPHNAGRKHDKSAVFCCTNDKDSARKRKARTSSSEILSFPGCAAKDTQGDSNIQQTSSSPNMNNISGPQTATAVDYSKAPFFAVTEDADKGQEKSQMTFSDLYANACVNPVSNDADKGLEGSQIPTVICGITNMSPGDLPELACKLSKKDSWKGNEAVVALPSKFIPTKVGTENADKSMITEEKSFYCTNSKMSQTSCGRKLEGNENKLPIAENVADVTQSLSEIGGFSLESCLDIPPISSITNLGSELSYNNLFIEFPSLGLINETMVAEEDKSAAKDSILDKASTANNLGSSQNMPSLKCSGDVGANPSACDMATCRFLLDEQGICYIIQNSIGNPRSNNVSTNLSNNDMDSAKYNVTFAPAAKEISFHHDIARKDLCSAPIAGCRNEESFDETALIGTINNDCRTQNGHLDTVGSNAAAIPKEYVPLCVGDAPQHISKIPKSQEGSDRMGGSCEHGVNLDNVSKDNEKFNPHPTESVLKAVKTEIMDPDDLSSPNSTYSDFSLLVNTLSWHELLESLPSSCGKWRHERKVVLLRDPSMRIWPVIYIDSFKFSGFLGGWESFVTGNNIRKGDTCHFETASHTEPLFQVQISRAPDLKSP